MIACCWPAKNAACACAFALLRLTQPAATSARKIGPKIENVANRNRVPPVPSSFEFRCWMFNLRKSFYAAAVQAKSWLLSWPLENFAKRAFFRLNLNNSRLVCAGCRWGGLGLPLGGFRHSRRRGHKRRGQRRRAVILLRLSVGRFWILIRVAPSRSIIEPGSIALEAPHPVFASCLHSGNDFEEVAIPNEVFNRIRRHQNLTFRNPHVKLRPETQPLRDDRQQTIRQLRRYSALYLRRKSGNHPLQCLSAR